MNLTKLFGLYGFARPYNFPRALAFMACLGLACAFFAMAKSHHVSLTHGFDTPYKAFHAYLFWGALAGAALSFRPLIGLCLFMFLSVDASVATLSHNLHAIRPHIADLMPDMNPMARRYAFHPLLQVVPKPSFETRDRGLIVRHNAEGLRGPERDAKTLATQNVIAAFGGSTTYDIGVNNGETWADRLEENLGPRFAVLNYGVPGYSTAEHILQTAFYANAYGVKPTCALYYIGWNDIRNAYIPNLDPGYADFHLPSQVDNLLVRPDPNATRVSSLLKIAYRATANLFDTLPHPKAYAPTDKTADDAALQQAFGNNVRTLSALNTAKGIKTVFVGQILNRARLTSEASYGWLPLVKDKDVWPLQARYNALLAKTAKANGATYIEPGIDNFADDDFIDNGHFSAKGSQNFARLIAPQVEQACKAEGASH